MLIDSHCHLLKSSNYKQDILDAKKEGIQTILNIATDIDEFDDIIAISNNYSGIYAALGLHPNCVVETKTHQNNDLNHILDKTLLKSPKNAKTIAIGEIGLDYYRKEENFAQKQKKEQIELFERQIDLAVANNIPIIVHSRDAEEDTIAILKNYPHVRGVIHCFTGTKEFAQKSLDLGFFISISGIITFKNAQEIKKIVKEIIPLDKLLVETDAPYLAPIPHRGHENKSAYLKHTAKEIALLKNSSFQEISQKTTNNFYQLFTKADKSNIL